MGKTRHGILDGFSGKVGPVVGYEWNGRSCLRALPVSVHDPCTGEQQAMRRLFADKVRLASRLNGVLRVGMRGAAAAERTTVGNLFIRHNAAAFAGGAGGLEVDYGRLAVALGGLEEPLCDAARLVGRWVEVDFEPPTGGYGTRDDCQVLLAAYVPQLGRALMADGASGRGGTARLELPEWCDGMEAHLYAFAADRATHASPSRWLGAVGV